MSTPTVVEPNQPLSHANNLDFLRLYFAISVLITHSYPLSGRPEYDILQQFSRGQASLSHTGVQGFLIISGYLIAKSLMRSTGFFDYYFKRVLRVFPGLLAVVGATVIICFFFSGKSAAAYFAHYSVRDYVVFNMLLKTQLYLDGVFTKNPYPNNVNGSLWTIPYEFFFYVVLSLCFFIRTKVKLLRWLFAGAYLAVISVYLQATPAAQAYELPFWHLHGQDMLELGGFFLSGTIWAVVPMPSIGTRQKLAGAAALLVLAGLYVGGYVYLQFLALPVLVIAFGTLNTPLISWARKYGDFSYGIYLWGFLVQQTLEHLFHFDFLALLLTSVPLTYLCGVLSWHLIEKRALKYKMYRRPVVVPVASTEPLLTN